VRTVSIRLPVGPERAFALLEDPRSFRALVAGVRRIRRFDPRWPEPGSAVHHSAGFPPLMVGDTSVVTECEPGRRLVLEARLHFVGRLIVVFEFAPDGTGSVLTLSECPTAGPVNLPYVRWLVEVVTAVRNAEMGRRFARLVADREALAATATGRGGRA